MFKVFIFFTIFLKDYTLTILHFRLFQDMRYSHCVYPCDAKVCMCVCIYGGIALLGGEWGLHEGVFFLYFVNISVDALLGCVY